MAVLHVHLDALFSPRLKLALDLPRRPQQGRPCEFAEIGPGHQPPLPHRKEPRQDEGTLRITGYPGVAPGHQRCKVLRRQGHLIPLRGLRVQRGDELIRVGHGGVV